MSTLEYTVSMLEAMPEEQLKEVQNYIQFITFRDTSNTLTELLSEDNLVEQLKNSMKKSDLGATTPASKVSQQMREKYGI